MTTGWSMGQVVGVWMGGPRRPGALSLGCAMLGALEGGTECDKLAGTTPLPGQVNYLPDVQGRKLEQKRHLPPGSWPGNESSW